MNINLFLFDLQISLRVILNLLIISILIPNGLLQEEGPELTEEYIDEEFPPEAGAEDVPQPTKPNNTNEINKKAQFAEDRFTQLFKNRRNRPRASTFFPKFASKAPPTLPPFIKNVAPLVKVVPTQATNQRSFTQKTTVAPIKSSTVRTPSRGNVNNNNANRRNQSNSNRSLNQSTPSPSTTESSSRRRFGSNSGFRRNTTATIPAIKPKRN